MSSVPTMLITRLDCLYFDTQLDFFFFSRSFWTRPKMWPPAADRRSHGTAAAARAVARPATSGGRTVRPTSAAENGKWRPDWTPRCCRGLASTASSPNLAISPLWRASGTPESTQENEKNSFNHTEYKQSGNGRFLAFISSWWKNYPRLVRVGVGCTSTPLSLYLPSRTMLQCTLKLRWADTLTLFHLYKYMYSVVFTKKVTSFRSRLILCGLWLLGLLFLIWKEE